MNTPEPLMFGGQPIVVGRIVHLVLDSPATGGTICVAATIVAATEAGSLELVRLDNHDRAMSVPWEPKGVVPRSWHWPDANRRQCQGRA
jgi:hypothetical protein